MSLKGAGKPLSDRDLTAGEGSILALVAAFLPWHMSRCPTTSCAATTRRADLGPSFKPLFFFALLMALVGRRETPGPHSPH
jgi:hypothetical protein